MTRPSLSELYRRSTASCDAQALDLDTLARLAAGENLGADHERVVAKLAQSAAHAAALRTALAVAPASEWLSSEAADPRRATRSHRARRVIARIRAPRWQWAALAASLFVGLAMLLPRGTPVTEVAPVAQHSQVLADDRILVGSFEEGAPALDGAAATEIAPDEGIFIDDFGT